MATELFATHGYEATAIPAVLHAAGVSRGALYHHFESKEALFEAVLKSVEARVMAKVTRSAGGASDPLDGLRRGCAAYLAMCRDPVVRRISLIERTGGDRLGAMARSTSSTPSGSSRPRSPPSPPMGG